jgi:hypothetical protein
MAPELSLLLFCGGTVWCPAEGIRSGYLGRYDDGLVRDFPLDRLRLADFRLGAVAPGTLAARPGSLLRLVRLSHDGFLHSV